MRSLSTFMWTYRNIYSDPVASLFYLLFTKFALPHSRNWPYVRKFVGCWIFDMFWKLLVFKSESG